jgi:hypothetical protein
MAQKLESDTREAPKKEIVDTPQEDAELMMAEPSLKYDQKEWR